MLSLNRTYSLVKDYSLIEKIQLLLLILLVSTLTLNTRLNSLFLGLFLFSLLFTFKLQNLATFKKPLIFFLFPFIYSLVSLIYSENIVEGKLVLERQLALFLLPFMFFASTTIKSSGFNLVIRIFFLSMVSICIYLLKCSAEDFVTSKVHIKEWFVKDNLYHSFAVPIRMHATYLSLYIAMAVFTGFHEFLSDNRWWIKVSIFLMTIVLIVTLTLLSSRVVISSVFFIIILIYPFYIWRLKNKFFLLIAGFVVLLTLFFVMRESSFITDRFAEKMRDEIKLTPFLKADTTYNPIYGGEMRADRWYCATELIKEKPFLGYGTGSEKEVLMKKYTKYNLQNAIIHNYDSHNQYLAYAIKGGIPGLLVFLFTIIYATTIALKKRSFIYLSFVLLFAITCVTEDVLESNKGIFFFAFFNSFFACYLLKQGLKHNQEKEDQTMESPRKKPRDL